ncbi:MAG TPA: valine--tRNA ligase [Bryobacteraceae bacterium]|jgi:valyl-tRNA synthetase|nr:valine--tRNA ligase [Bryobacteraceae bacterium]
MQLDKVYEPRRFEPRWAQWWVESGIYRAEYQPADSDKARPAFSLVIPPPNVTGSLHMGHMLEHTEIDVTVRWHRMRGDTTLWLPGMDHAGIATQMVVERQLAEEGLDRRAMGREAFEARVWKWKAESGGTIKRQMIQLGASCDWSRERFTLDPGLSRAVRETFVSLYEKGLVYRGEYMVNWCPRCRTAISDLETIHEETAGHLWHIRYPVVGKSDQYLVVATTRPETMLGDTAVAINARDERYRDLHGRMVRLPLMDREIPIILDDIADPEFGTGVVKITPAHDMNDFEAGKRHNLPMIQVIDESAKITLAGGSYAGLDRYEARERVVEDLKDLGLLDSVENYTLSLGKCSRCKTPIEPLVSKQWFVKTKPLAAKAIQAVDEKRIEIIPENWVKTWNEWMHNIRDWCVSRQLWWGHRIPAWYCDACGETIVSRTDPDSCSKCSGALRQDADVLDTWFSSGLWPFSTLGWPDKTDDLKHFYPTTLLITGFDILFFWVARMAMLGIEFMGDVPFRQVYIHGLVRDAEKQKMSKTKGNVIDPLIVTEEYGTDAVRMALLSGAAPGTDIAFTTDRIDASRAFANKIWNAARFILSNPDTESESLFEDLWIRSRFNECARQMNEAIQAFRYHEAAQTIWHFIWDDFCDWYIELKKIRGNWRWARTVFVDTLCLLHPLMPFITEELWHRFVEGEGKSISLESYPQFNLILFQPEEEEEMDLLQNIVRAARNLRAELGLDPKQPLEGKISIGIDAELLRRLCGVTFTRGDVPKTGAVRSTPDFDLSIDVPTGQIEAQRRRLEKERDQLMKNIANSQRQLNDEVFLSKAPAKVVDSIRAKLAEYEAQLAKIEASLNG